ncbi:hypothetical protein GDO81_006562 [Engystomops pustulosus]|uniref:Fibronectin type-III domain-containing protein n=2 Tax=Engystomops pustulosus TaxID=76066 RepID=A0AAV7CXL9_ENGPU|nr:hypothetical protein GDO81_006562 [Engystomops pustulosus]
MHIRMSMIFLWILCQCFQYHLCCNIHDLEYDFGLKNLSMTIKKKEAIVTWDCDVPREKLSDVSYAIYLHWEYEMEVKGCGKEIVLILPDDLPTPICVQVAPVLHDKNCPNASEICLNPGRNEMEENIQCITYNISSIKCTWTFAKNLPHETNFSLTLIQDATIIHCQQYAYDMEMRTGYCSFHDLTINYFENVLVMLSKKGSEDHVLKDYFKPADKELFNPPRNLTLTYLEDNVLLSWKPPHTQYDVSESCFIYQMEKNKELTSDVSNPHFINIETKCSVRIRVKGENICGMNENWGQWSEEISCGAPQEVDKTLIIFWIPFLVLSCFLITSTIIISLQYQRISKLFFPRIPQPKIFLDETQDYKTNTRSDPLFHILSTSETEDFITLQENN